jgi:tRNA-dihydrouridine synthase A
VFAVHARNAWLHGLSPRENREVPPLRHEFVHRLKRDFPALTIVVNGGLATADQIAAQLEHVDGVMLGREAYRHPWTMSDWDSRFFGPGPGAAAKPGREQVEEAMVAYMEREAAARGTPWPAIARHMIGLFNGTPGARIWRQVWSDHRLEALPPREVWRVARQRRAPVRAVEARLPDAGAYDAGLPSATER